MTVTQKLVDAIIQISLSGEKLDGYGDKTLMLFVDQADKTLMLFVDQADKTLLLFVDQADKRVLI